MAAVRTQMSCFVAGLPEEVDEDSLAKHIERTDRTLSIKSIKILRSIPTMRSKGIAIIEFNTPEESKAHMT